MYVYIAEGLDAHLCPRFGIGGVKVDTQTALGLRKGFGIIVRASR